MERTAVPRGRGRHCLPPVVRLPADFVVRYRVIQLGGKSEHERGLAGHVAKDISSDDPRYTTLPEADKREVVAWARMAAQALREEHLRCLDALLLTIDPVLQEAL